MRILPRSLAAAACRRRRHRARRLQTRASSSSPLPCRPRPMPPGAAATGSTARQVIAIAAAPSGTRKWQFRWRGELAPLDRTIDHRGVIAALPPMASPRGSYLPAGSGWYPETTLPVHYRVRVELPSGQRAVVPGRLVSESADGTGSHAVYESILPTEGVTLMAGPYRVDERLLPLPGGRAVAVAEETHCFASSAGYPNAALLEQILSRMPMPSCAGVDGGEVCTHEEGGRGSRRLTSNPAYIVEGVPGSALDLT